MNRGVPAFRLPSDLQDRLDEFCEKENTGQVQFDLKRGRVLAWRITQTGRLDRTATPDDNDDD